MEDNVRPPLTHDSTPGFPDVKNELGLLREELSPRLCLPVTVEPVCLANESDTTSDQRYAFGQRPIEFVIDYCATHRI